MNNDIKPIYLQYIGIALMFFIAYILYQMYSYHKKSDSEMTEHHTELDKHFKKMDKHHDKMESNIPEIFQRNIELQHAEHDI